MQCCCSSCCCLSACLGIRQGLVELIFLSFHVHCVTDGQGWLRDSSVAALVFQSCQYLLDSFDEQNFHLSLNAMPG